MKNIKLFIKGIIIGCAAILPGVSGGTLAITLGIYEKLVKIASKFYVDFKENVKFLIPIALGSGIGVLMLSTVISFVFEEYESTMTLLFLGLLLGGIPSLLKKVKKKSINKTNIIIAILFFLVSLLLMVINENGTNVSFANMNIYGYLMLFFVGLIAAATLVIPGVSGSLILIIMGYYKPIIDVISSLLKFNNLVNDFLILFPFGLGVLIGIILISKLINYLLFKYPEKTYYAIFGIVFASIIGILIPLESGLGIVLLFVGSYLVYRMGD